MTRIEVAPPLCPFCLDFEWNCWRVERFLNTNPLQRVSTTVVILVVVVVVASLVSSCKFLNVFGSLWKCVRVCELKIKSARLIWLCVAIQFVCSFFSTDIFSAWKANQVSCIKFARYMGHIIMPFEISNCSLLSIFVSSPTLTPLLCLSHFPCRFVFRTFDRAHHSRCLSSLHLVSFHLYCVANVSAPFKVVASGHKKSSLAYSKHTNVVKTYMKCLFVNLIRINVSMWRLSWGWHVSNYCF